MKKWFIANLFLMPLSVFSTLTTCLEEFYRIDKNTSFAIENILAKRSTADIIEKFMQQSNELEFSCVGNAKSPDDALIKAPNHHNKLFENDSIRILEVTLEPGDTDPLHLHEWDCLFITLQGSILESENEIEECYPDSEYLPRDTHPQSYKNIGENTFHALVFEIKS